MSDSSLSMPAGDLFEDFLNGGAAALLVEAESELRTSERRLADQARLDEERTVAELYDRVMVMLRPGTAVAIQQVQRFIGYGCRKTEDHHVRIRRFKEALCSKAESPVGDYAKMAFDAFERHLVAALSGIARFEEAQAALQSGDMEAVLVALGHDDQGFLPEEQEHRAKMVAATWSLRAMKPDENWSPATWTSGNQKVAQVAKCAADILKIRREAAVVKERLVPSSVPMVQQTSSPTKKPVPEAVRATA